MSQFRRFVGFICDNNVDGHGAVVGSALLQPGPAGVPQHDALLQAVDVGVLGSVAHHLAGPAAARKVPAHAHTHSHDARIPSIFIAPLYLEGHAHTATDTHAHTG